MRPWASVAILGLWAAANPLFGAVSVCDEPSLRAAVAAGGNITFDCNGTIVLSSPLVITQSVTLNATGRNVTISGNNQVRIFEVGYGFSLHLINLTIAHGFVHGTNGAPHQPGGSAEGAAVRFTHLGTVRAKDCRFIDNRAVGGRGGDGSAGPPGNGGSARGGVVSGSSAVYLTNCFFSGNAAEGGPAGVPDPPEAPSNAQPGSGNGGALAISGLFVRDCTFTTNTAAAGGAIYCSPFGASISNCLFVANRAGAGGAIFHAGGGPLSISNSVFVANSADRNPGAGGAISAGALNLSKSYFASNTALGKPGAVSPRFTDAGNAMGGAVSIGEGAILECTFEGNIARGGNGCCLNPPGFTAAGAGMGGAIFASGGLTTVRNGTFVHNIASSGVGQRFDSGASGGALACGAGELRIQYSTIASNAAISFTNSAYGGGVVQLAVGATARVYLENSILSGNTTNGVFGGNAHPLFLNGGYNVSSDGTPIWASTTNNIDPRLGALADNGGPVPTMALLTGSPALDFTHPAGCPLTDARGVARWQSRACDAGAFEQTFMAIQRLESDVLIRYWGPPNETFALDASPDLILWEQLATQPTFGDHPSFFRVPGGGTSGFFRARLLP